MAFAVYRFVPFKYRVAKLLRHTPLPLRVKRQLYFDGVIEAEIDQDHSFLVNSYGPIERNLFWYGFGRGWEGTSLRSWTALAQRAGTILDIGANTGVYALAARAMNPAARIIAFEPFEPMHQRLVANAELNAYDIEAKLVAASDRDGSATLHEGPAAFAASLEEPTDPALGRPEHTVEVIRLDSYCAASDVGSIDLIKIDIEGHEPAAIAGMGEMLARFKPTFLIEVLSRQAGDLLMSMLQPQGYELYRVDETRGLVRVHDLTPPQGKNRNYIVCQPGTIEKAGLMGLLLPAASD